MSPVETAARIVSYARSPQVSDKDAMELVVTILAVERGEGIAEGLRIASEATDRAFAKALAS